MITLTYIILAVAPMLAALLACMAIVPVLVALHVRRAEAPTDDTSALQPWDEVLADLDRPQRLRSRRSWPRPAPARAGMSLAELPRVRRVWRPATSGVPPDMSHIIRQHRPG